MDLRTSEANIGAGLKQELLRVEAFSDGQDVDSDPESANVEVSSVAEVKISTRTWVSGIVFWKLSIFLFGLVSVWTGCYFTYLGSLPRIAFGRHEAEGFAISLAGFFTVVFVFVCLLFMTLLVWFPCVRRFWWVVLICALLITTWVSLVGFGTIRFDSSVQLLSSCPLFGILVAMNHGYMIILLSLTQLHLHAKHLWGFVEATKALGGLLGLFLWPPTGQFALALLAVCVAPIVHWRVLHYVDRLLAKTHTTSREDTYWYTILSRVIRNRSFWSLTCYCVFCSGPFLVVSYWWCSAYLMDIYSLDGVSGNETVAFIWTGVAVGSILLPHLFIVFRPTKWIPFAMSVAAFLVSLCITLVPCWQMNLKYFGILLFLLGMTAGSCRGVVYPLYSDQVGAVASCFALALTTSLTVLFGFVYHLILYSLLSFYRSNAKSGSMEKRLNGYQLSVWLPCVICFGLASFAILWVREPAAKHRKVSVEEAWLSMELDSD